MVSTPNAFIDSVPSPGLARKKKRVRLACVIDHLEVGARGLAHLAAAALTLLAAASIASAIMLTAYAFVPCPRARRRSTSCKARSQQAELAQPASLTAAPGHGAEC